MPAPDPKSQIPAEPLPCTIQDGFVFAAVGDLLGPTRPEMPMRRQELLAVATHLQSATVAFANLEGSLFDLDTFSGYRAAENGGGYPVADEPVAADLKAMGLDVVSTANNHSTDWGVEGMLATNRALDAAGVMHAGSGPSKAAARAPAFLETPAGRVAVLCAASTFTPMSEAGQADGEVAPRPGISVLKTTAVTRLPEADMEVIRRAAKLQGLGTSLDSRALGSANRVILGQETFELGDKAGLHYQANPFDHADLLRSVRAAKQVSDFVAFALHGHESESGDGEDRRPANFMQPLFRNAIDAGADIALTTGPHIVRGIEIYKGKPIFYGLGSFFLQLEGGRGPTQEMARLLGIDAHAVTKSEALAARFTLPEHWFESVLTQTHYAGGQVSEIRLYPLMLERKTQFRLQGAPRLATGKDAERILKQLQQDSQPFGTEISIENSVGFIRLQRM